MSSVSGVKSLWFANIFSKGLIDDYWNNKMPDPFSPYLRNIRVRNWATIIRKWHVTKVEDSNWTYVRGITANYYNDILLAVRNKQLSEISLTAGTYTDKWAVSTTDKDVNLINYWKYTIVLNWEDYPYVYDWSSVTKLTSSEIEANANPLFWDVFADY